MLVVSIIVATCSVPAGLGSDGVCLANAEFRRVLQYAVIRGEQVEEKVGIVNSMRKDGIYSTGRAMRRYKPAREQASEQGAKLLDSFAPAIFSEIALVVKTH